MRYLAGLLAGSLLLAGCDGDKPKQTETKTQAVKPRVQRLEGVQVPDFNADSAYQFVAKQVAFGPRVPNTKPHRQTGDWLVETLEGYGAEVTVQDFTATAYDGTELYLRNIIASFKPEARKRIALAAHWDTRPYADREEDESLWRTPIEGANDGGSGVGVLLEVARQFSNSELPQAGVDLIFFDGEDYGAPEFVENRPGDERSWALGSQYWMSNLHKPGYSAYYGILLDMVGAPNATFYREGYSREYAPSVVEKVWAWGNELGYSQYFKYLNSEAIIDDHVYMNAAGIPTIDIIQFDPASDFYFGPYHHRISDNLEGISRETLEAVGETVLHVVYNEPNPAS